MICFSLIKNEIEHIFIYLLTIWISFLVKRLFRFLSISNRLSVYSYCFMEVLYSAYKSFIRYMYYRYCFPICGLLSLSLNGFVYLIDIQKSIILMKSNLLLFSFIQFLCPVKNSFPVPVMKYSPMFSLEALLHYLSQLNL